MVEEQELATSSEEWQPDDSNNNVKYRLYYHQPKGATRGTPRLCREYKTLKEAILEESRAIKIGLLHTEIAAVINNAEPNGWWK